MTVKRALIYLTLASFALPIIWVVGYRQVNPPVGATTETYIVQPRDAAITVSTFGTIQAAQVVNLSFPVGGKVVEMLVEAGDYVRAGDALARLDSRAQYAAYGQANLNYELAVRQLQELQTVDENAVQVAEANLQSAQNTYTDVANAVTDEDIAMAELQYQQAQETLTAAEEARRYANPARQSAEAIALLDAQIGEASFNAETARLRLEALRTANQGELGSAVARIAQAQAELDQVLAGASEAEVELAEINIEGASIALDQASLDYDQTLLYAPFDGVVAAGFVQVGQRVGTGTTVLQLVDVTPLSFRGEVDEADIRQISIGTPAQIELDALPGETFVGQLTWIAPQGRDEGGLVVYDVDIQLAAADSRVRPGMSADGSIITGEAQDVLLIPGNFIRTDAASGQVSVNVLLRNGRTQERTVTTGSRFGSDVEITSGIQAGETITAVNDSNHGA